MTRRVSKFELPFAYEGMHDDPAYWRDVGYGVVVNGEPLTVIGAELPELWRWFDRATAHALRVDRFGCAHCSKPTPVAQVEIVRDAGAGEPVAAVTYQQRRLIGSSREVVVRRAVLHVPGPGMKCDHGPLICHPDAEPVLTFCRRCGDQPVPWPTVVEAIRKRGGWRVTESDLKISARLR